MEIAMSALTHILDDAAIEAKAKELYEASRKHISGRRPWETLDPNNELDENLRQHALGTARRCLEDIVSAASKN